MNRSLSSATKWLSSTAIKLFSSSSESVTSTASAPIANAASAMKQQEKRSRGRPKKPPVNSQKPTGTAKRRNLTFNREIESIKLVTQSRTRLGSNSGIANAPPMEDDGQVRYLLTLKALPNNLRIIAQLLHPVPQNKYEEHQLACKLLNENSTDTPGKKKEIFIPTFRRLESLRGLKEVERAVEKELISDSECLHRHRPLELAERRERRREEELLRYEEYIRKLSREYPELLNRKYSFSASASTSTSSMA